MRGLPKIRREQDESAEQPAAEPTPAPEPVAAPEPPTVVHDAATQPTDTWPAAAAPVGAAVPPAVPATAPPADLDPAQLQVAAAPSFRDRGRLRRRLSYLRRVRELGFRDLGGLMFDLSRFGREGQPLIAAKLEALTIVDRELRALERVLKDKPLYVDLREPGIAACPRCAALHGSDANFCPNCGIKLTGPMGIGEIGGHMAPVTHAPPSMVVTPNEAPPITVAPQDVAPVVHHSSSEPVSMADQPTMAIPVVERSAPPVPEPAPAPEPEPTPAPEAAAEPAPEPEPDAEPAAKPASRRGKARAKKAQQQRDAASDEQS